MSDSVVQSISEPLLSRDSAGPLITLFALPKPFSGEAELLQRNALASWRSLGADVQILLAGNDEGVADTADEFGVEYLGPLRKSDRGTPYLDHLFELAHSRAAGELLMYVNADILLFPDTLEVARQLLAGGPEDFLATGRRWDLDVEDPLPTEHPRWSDAWLREARRRGRWAPLVCKDYFLFPRHLYKELPPFMVGRGNWDNWMVYQAKSLQMPVIDVTEGLTAVHQNHGYGHLTRGRLEAYVTGAEARHNESVGGGKHLLSGASADWELMSDGTLRRIAAQWRFIRDLPRFVRLLHSFSRSG